MDITKENFKTAYPDLHKEIREEAFGQGFSAGLVKGKEDGAMAGAEAERSRIKDVESQTLPGHEDLIQTLKFDGKTMGPEAAVKILKAEKEMVSKKHSDFVADGQGVQVPTGNPPVIEPKTEGPKKDFFTLVDEYQAAQKCSRTEAIQAVAKANPEAHAAYIQAINPKKE